METQNINEQKSKNILVVDDEEGIREILQMSLEIEGYNVQTAANGREALDILSKSPDQGLILLDLMMPVMNGWEFVEEIGKMKQYSDIPIVLVTAYDDRAKGMNVEEVISKPMEFKKLLNIVRKHCGVKKS